MSRKHQSTHGCYKKRKKSRSILNKTRKFNPKSYRASKMFIASVLIMLLLDLCTFISTTTLTDYDGATFYKALVGSRVRIACNGSHWSARDDDQISLILWFKGSSTSPSWSSSAAATAQANSSGQASDRSLQGAGNQQSTIPIYTIDARQRPLSQGARHLIADSYKGRAKFVTKSSPPYLDLYPLEADDQSEYRCRIDYRTKPRENFLIILFVIVPPKSVQILDSNGKSLAQSGKQIYGPLSESSDLTLLCFSRGGRPAPAITWRHGHKVIDDSYLTLSDFVTLNRPIQRTGRAPLNFSQPSWPQSGTTANGENVSSANGQPKSQAPAIFGQNGPLLSNQDELHLDNNSINISSSSDSSSATNGAASIGAEFVNGQQQFNINQANSLFQQWRHWPEFDFFSNNQTTLFGDQNHLSAGPRSGGHSLPLTDSARKVNLDYTTATGNGLESNPGHNAQQLLTLNVHDSITTSLNVLKLTNLASSLNLIAAGNRIKGPGPVDYDTYTQLAAASGAPPAAHSGPIAIECEASNLHYDLKMLIKLFTPPSLSQVRWSNVGQQLKWSWLNEFTSAQSQVRQLVEAIDQSVEINLLQASGSENGLGAGTAGPSIQQAAFQQQIRDSGRNLAQGDNLNINLAAFVYHQLFRPHQLFSHHNTQRLDNDTESLIRSQRVSLDVFVRPSDVRITNPRRPLAAGQVAEFVCQSSGSNPPARLAWFKNGQPISAKLSRQLDNFSEQQHENQQLFNGTSLSKLSIQIERQDNEAQLSCRAENEQLNKLNKVIANQDQASFIEDSRLLSVHFAPRLKLELGNRMLSNSIRELSDIYFACQVEANPPIKDITWVHNGRPLNETKLYLDQLAELANKQPQQQQDDRSAKGLIISNNSSLVLQKVKLEQRGFYSCMASNSEGISESNRIELKVLHAPICSLASDQAEGDILTRKTVPLHGKLKLLCEMEANPSNLELVWYLNNSFIDRKIISKEHKDPEVERLQTGTGERRESLQRQSSDKQPIVSSQLNYLVRSSQDYGRLFCVAKNLIGEQKRACVYEIQPPDPSVQAHDSDRVDEQRFECLAVNVTSHSVWIGCGLDQQQQQESAISPGDFYKFTIEIYSSQARDFASSRSDFEDSSSESWDNLDISQADSSKFLEANLTSTNLDEPLFLVGNLKPTTNYLIKVYPSRGSLGGLLDSQPVSIVKFSTTPRESAPKNIDQPESGPDKPLDEHKPTIGAIFEPHQPSNLLLSAFISTRSTRTQSAAAATIDSMFLDQLKARESGSGSSPGQQRQSRKQSGEPAASLLGAWFDSAIQSLSSFTSFAGPPSGDQRASYLNRKFLGPNSKQIRPQSINSAGSSNNNQLMDISDSTIVGSAFLLLSASLAVVLILYCYSSAVCSSPPPRTSGDDEKFSSKSVVEKERVAEEEHTNPFRSDSSSASTNSGGSLATHNRNSANISAGPGNDIRRGFHRHRDCRKLNDDNESNCSQQLEKGLLSLENEQRTLIPEPDYRAANQANESIELVGLKDAGRNEPWNSSRATCLVAAAAPEVEAEPNTAKFNALPQATNALSQTIAWPPQQQQERSSTLDSRVNRRDLASLQPLARGNVVSSSNIVGQEQQASHCKRDYYDYMAQAVNLNKSLASHARQQELRDRAISLRGRQVTKSRSSLCFAQTLASLGADFGSLQRAEVMQTSSVGEHGQNLIINSAHSEFMNGPEEVARGKFVVNRRARAKTNTTNSINQCKLMGSSGALPGPRQADYAGDEACSELGEIKRSVQMGNHYYGRTLRALELGGRSNGAVSQACNLNHQQLTSHNASKLYQAFENGCETGNANQLLGIVVPPSPQPSELIGRVGGEQQCSTSLISDVSSNDSNALAWCSMQKQEEEQQMHFIELLPVGGDMRDLEFVLNQQMTDPNSNGNYHLQLSSQAGELAPIVNANAPAILCPSSLTSSNSIGTNSSSMARPTMNTISPSSTTTLSNVDTPILGSKSRDTMKRRTDAKPASILKNSTRYRQEESLSVCHCEEEKYIYKSFK